MQQGVLQNVRSNRKSTCTAHVHSRSSRRRDAGGGSRQFTVWEKPAAEKLLVSAAQGVKKLKVYRLLPAQAAFRRYTALLWSSLSASDGCNNVHTVRDFPNMRSYGANPPRCTVLCRMTDVIYRHMARNIPGVPFCVERRTSCTVIWRSTPSGALFYVEWRMSCTVI